MPNNSTFDGKRVIKPVGLIDVDAAMKNWWDFNVNIHVAQQDGTKKKVPVWFIAPERWHIARQEGVRDANGTIILPIIAVTRTRIGGPNEAPFQRTIADIKQDKIYYQQVHPKSSLVAELNKARPLNLDPTKPIYEVFTTKVPDFYNLTYEVKIWTQYISEMNEILEKMAQNFHYLSVKSFSFFTESGFRLTAFQSEDNSDDSNFDDYSDNERIVRQTLTFNVPAYIFPQVDDKRSPFKRYLSQTRIVIKESTE